MNLDGTLFWIAVLSCAAALVRSAPLLRQGRNLGWGVLSIAILAAAGAGEIFFPAWAGRVIGSLWLGLIVLPSLLIHATLRCALRQRYSQAQRLAWMVRLLHPADGWREMPELYRALALSQTGRREEAAAALHAMLDRPNIQPMVAHAVRAQLCRITGQWEQFLVWMESVEGQGKVTASNTPHLDLERFWNE